jgi:hypothetical protein
MTCTLLGLIVKADAPAAKGRVKTMVVLPLTHSTCRQQADVWGVALHPRQPYRSACNVLELRAGGKGDLGR